MPRMPFYAGLFQTETPHLVPLVPCFVPSQSLYALGVTPILVLADLEGKAHASCPRAPFRAWLVKKREVPHFVSLSLSESDPLPRFPMAYPKGTPPSASFTSRAEKENRVPPLPEASL